MMICINCGWSNPDEVVCCEKCGQSLRHAFNESYSNDSRPEEDDFMSFAEDNITKAVPELICNRYQPSHVLISNSASSIIIAKDLLTDEDVCLNIYESTDNWAKEISLKEYKFLVQLKGFRILSPSFYGISPVGSPFYVAPVVNRLVSEYIGEIGFDFIERFLREMSLTLRGLKAKNISCGNLKPETIALDRDGHFYLLPDAFSEICRHAITITGGTFSDISNPYMAPEFFTGNPGKFPADKGDLWALGAIAYELITGTKPFGHLGGATQRINGNYEDRFNFHSTEVVDYPRLLRLQYIIRRLLELDATQRASFDFVFDSMSLSIVKSQQVSGRYSIVHPIRRIIGTVECDEISSFSAQCVPGPGPIPPILQHFIGAFYKKGDTCGYLRLYDDGHIGK